MATANANTDAARLNEFPTMLFPYKFGEPTILLPFITPKTLNILDRCRTELVAIGELAELTGKYRWAQWVSFRTVPVELARTLAKIAYCRCGARTGHLCSIASYPRHHQMPNDQRFLCCWRRLGPTAARSTRKTYARHTLLHLQFKTHTNCRNQAIPGSPRAALPSGRG